MLFLHKNNAMLSLEHTIFSAREAGFDLCGAAPCHPQEQARRRFEEWLREGCDADLQYLRRNIDKRFDPALLVEEARSVIVCAVNYKNDTSLGYPAGCSAPRIASYARTADYHRSIREMLRDLFALLEKRCPGLRGRAFVDSAPLAEKCWAREAGLGWQGRNSLLVTPQFGSFVLLGELVVNAPFDRYSEPCAEQGCGSCRACLRACPKGAIGERRTIDARRCISCLTVEAGDGPRETCGWLFGCDLCQSVCPYNRAAPLHTNPRFDPLFDPRELSAEWWNALSEEEFDRRFADTPMARGGLPRLRRNLGSGR